MPPGRNQARCLTSNAFRVERLVQHLLASRLKSHRYFSTTWIRFNEAARAVDSPTLTEKEKANAAGLDVLKETLRKMRLKNRGIDSPVVRKVKGHNADPMISRPLPRTLEIEKEHDGLKGPHKTMRINHRMSQKESPYRRKIERDTFSNLTFGGSRTSYDKVSIMVDDSPSAETDEIASPVEQEKRPVRNVARDVVPKQNFLYGKPSFNHLRGPPKDLRPVRNKSGIMRYIGWSVEPDIDLPAEIATPWLSEATKQRKDQERLIQEIKDFEAYIMPTKAESEAKQEVTRRVQEIITKITNGTLKTDLFGSLHGGYALAQADIDLRLYLPRNEFMEAAPSKSETLPMGQVLRLFRKTFLANGFTKFEIHRSRYPLINMYHEASGIKVQIVAGNCTTPANTYIKSNIARHPEIMSIYAILRTMLQMRNLTDVFHGGLNSYPLLIMIIATFKLYPGTDAAEHLANFLEFYGSLNSKKQSIGLVPPMLHPKIPTKPTLPQNPSILDQWVFAKRMMGSKNWNMPFLLTLQDPVDKNNDLGHKAFAWLHIKQTFLSSLSALQHGLEYQRTLDQQRGSLLLPLIGGADEYFGPARRKVQRFGEALARGKKWEYQKPAQEGWVEQRIAKLVVRMEEAGERDLPEQRADAYESEASWASTAELLAQHSDSALNGDSEPSLRDAELSLSMEDAESEVKPQQQSSSSGEEPATMEEQDIEALRTRVEKGNLL